MTDPELIDKKLAFIETCLAELRSQAQPDELEVDIRERRFVEHTLQLAIQAALDVASHIISDGRLGEPTTNRELFLLLGRHNWVDRALTTRLERMAGFRNVLVHGYTDVRVDVLRDVVLHQLGDLESFVNAVRSRLP